MILRTLALTITVFVIDLFTPLGYSTWLLYAVPLVYVSSKASRTTVILAAGCITLLVVADFFISPSGVSPSISAVNRTLGISALWALSLLNYRRKSTEESLREYSAGLNAANKSLAESKANLRTVFDSSNDAIFIHELDGKIIDVNKKMQELYDVEYEEALSLSIRNDFSSPDNPLDSIPEIWKDVVSGKSRSFEWKARRPKDGSVFDAEVFLTKIRLRKKDVILAVVRDITSRKHAEQELRKAYRGLESKVQERTRELAQATMELRGEIEQRKEIEEELRKSQKQLSSITASVAEGIYVLDAKGRIIFMNPEAERLLGWTLEEMGEKSPHDLVHFRTKDGTPLPIEKCNMRGVINTGKRYSSTDEVFVRKDGTVFPISVISAPVLEGGKIIASITAFHDITDQKRQEEALLANERRLTAILNSIPDMAWLKDKESRFIVVNEPFAEACGKTPAELTGKTDFDAWPKKLAEQYFADDREVMKNHARKRYEEPLATKDGRARWIETIKTPIYDEEGQVIGTTGIARDITDRKRMEEEIRHLALHDALTGLPNRRLFKDILELELAQARRNRSKAAVLFLDLDRFKEINDTLGHDAGDLLLKETALRVKASIRQSDTVARIGGDEFNIMVSDIERAEDAAEVAIKIIESLKRMFVIGGHELHITTSIGISVFPDDSTEQEILLSYADIAMYHAKERGRDQYRFYNPVINIKSLERTRLESSLQQALDRDEFVLHYLPQMDLATGRMTSAEALVRWNHPEKGLLEPGSFIPAAEDIGLVAAIDEWVLKTACSQVRNWAIRGLEKFTLTVNLSGPEFRNPDLAGNLAAILKQTGLDAERLNIELSEHSAMDDIGHSVSMMTELAGMGIRITIDGFGTGCSSVSYLKRLPIERIKIDKSFIRDIATDPDDRGVIHAMTAMAHTMKIKVAAEGVETQAQLSFLSKARCDEAQGFLFSRPVPAEKFRGLLAHSG